MILVVFAGTPVALYVEASMEYYIATVFCRNYWSRYICVV